MKGGGGIENRKVVKKGGQRERVAEGRWKRKHGLGRDGWGWTDSEERWAFNLSTVAWRCVCVSNGVLLKHTWTTDASTRNVQNHTLVKSLSKGLVGDQNRPYLLSQ